MGLDGQKENRYEAATRGRKHQAYGTTRKTPETTKFRAPPTPVTQGISEDLNDAALNLCVNRARIERPANILEHGVTQYLHVPRVRVDGDFAIMHGKDRKIDRIDEMARRAAGHRRDARVCKGSRSRQRPTT